MNQLLVTHKKNQLLITHKINQLLITRNGTKYFDLRKDIIDTHYAVRPWWTAVMHDSSVALYPNPASMLGQ